jgi:hypothetical protein
LLKGSLAYSLAFFWKKDKPLLPFVMLVQFFGMVCQAACQVCAQGIVNGCNIGHNWANTLGLHALVCARAHAATHKDFTVGNRLGHASVFLVGMGVLSVTRAVIFVAVFVLVLALSGKVGMAKFLAHFAGCFLAICQCYDQVMTGAPKMLADGSSVIGNECDFHG